MARDYLLIVFRKKKTYNQIRMQARGVSVFANKFVIKRETPF